MKINEFRGDLTNASAKAETLLDLSTPFMSHCSHPLQCRKFEHELLHKWTRICQLRPTQRQGQNGGEAGTMSGSPQTKPDHTIVGNPVLRKYGVLCFLHHLHGRNAMSLLSIGLIRHFKVCYGCTSQFRCKQSTSSPWLEFCCDIMPFYL